ncbi:cytochrome c oxidase subunit 3 [Flavobacterium aquaticum]|jgi:cytochrome c oxidase subunit 3|uniref:Cytochrome c oxidase subunit 3 n=1 Tax=Flavobacterium aquaticum TaxID=1236486 RepID=A0A327YVI3_9FLAO|nr:MULTISPECIES: cytochrome c oxidase subunit 3 [Flavobacterium]MCK6609115.1 cytochrome c oxidase subunit 3 [Flavobacterium sp.]RAK24366.1 cytochrome c oxidase subunit 3 [Flavobacterium aquaticum]TXI67923.1 MAG: cytochrome oxidase subunit III [Flavobacterium sp.]
MGATVITDEHALDGGPGPLGATYGKMMMWFFILSDALTFSGFLAAYGFSRFKFIETWPIADEVFNHFPFLHGVNAPMYYVALMTFILIFSSVTMVLAVDAGHHMKKTKVAFYMFLTIIGGFIFLGSQAWEWKNFIKGEYGAVETKGGSILQFVQKQEDGTFKRVALADFAATLPEARTQHERSNGVWFMDEATLPTYSVNEVVEGFKSDESILVRSEYLNAEKHKTVLSRAESLKRLEEAKYVVEGANLVRNEYGHKLFANFFFFITGFHGFHVFTGVLINIIIFFNVLLGTYEKRKSYEMVEKVGLYWHFVDLVWVFVFTFFYLV